MWWRVFIPTWRFFDSVGSHPQLYVQKQGQWQPVIQRPQLYWYSLFFNPRGNYYHACNNLLERLVQEISAGQDPEKLVSYQLVKDLVGANKFKITVNGEDFLQAEA